MLITISADHDQLLRLIAHLEAKRQQDAEAALEVEHAHLDKRQQDAEAPFEDEESGEDEGPRLKRQFLRSAEELEQLIDLIRPQVIMTGRMRN